MKDRENENENIEIIMGSTINNQDVNNNFMYHDDLNPIDMHHRSSAVSTSLITEHEIRIRYGDNPGKRSLRAYLKSIYKTLCGMDRFKQGVKNSIPILEWLPKYQFKTMLPIDLLTALTVGVVLVPQGLSYGLLAGMPPEYGLYSCLVAPVIYVIFGSCIQLQIGPFALISLMVIDTVGNIVDPDTEPAIYIQTVLACSITVGAFLILLSFLRVGFFVNFLSMDVMSGLTTGGAFLISTSQMPSFLGITIPRDGFFQTWINLFKHISEINFATTLIGVICLGILIAFRKFKEQPYAQKRRWIRRFPIALAVMGLALLISWSCSFHEKYNVKVVGSIPSGIPGPFAPISSVFNVNILLPTVVISIVGFALSIATAKTFAEKNNYEIDPNQELLALGCANLISGFFNSFPSFSSLSRSALVHEIGARSLLYNIMSALLVAFVLLFLTGALVDLPISALCAIIFDALYSLFLQLKQPVALWRTSKRDCFVWVVTFAAVLGLGIAIGLAIGIVASILVLLHFVSEPTRAVLGRIPKVPWLYRNVERFRDVEQIPGVVIFRFDSSLHFASRDSFKESLFQAVENHRTRFGTVHSLVMDVSSMTHIDHSGMEYLKKINAKLEEEDIEIILANCRGSLRDRLKIAHCSFQEYVCVHDAVMYAQHKRVHPTREQQVEETRTGATSVAAVTETTTRHRLPATGALSIDVTDNRIENVSEPRAHVQPFEQVRHRLPATGALSIDVTDDRIENVSVPRSHVQPFEQVRSSD